MPSQLDMETRVTTPTRLSIPVAMAVFGLSLVAVAGFLIFSNTNQATAISCTKGSVHQQKLAKNNDQKKARQAVATTSKALGRMSDGDLTTKLKDKNFRNQLSGGLNQYKQAWLHLAANDPDGAMTGRLPSGMAKKLASVSQDCVEQPVNLSGTMNIFHGDTFGGHNAVSEFDYRLVTAKGLNHIHFGRGIPNIMTSNTPVQLSGLALDDQVVVDGTASIENPNGDFGGSTLVAAPSPIKKNYSTSTSLAAGPVISNIAATYNSGSSLVYVNWTTDIPADGVLNYGLSATYGGLKSVTSFVTSHTLTFPASPGLTYHYAIRACTSGGQCTTTPDMMVTATVAPPVLSARTIVFSNGTALVSWTTTATEAAADGTISYGLTTTYTGTSRDAALTLSHTVAFAVNLNTLYHFSITACNSAGVCTTTPDATLTSPAIVGPVITAPAVMSTKSTATATWTSATAADSFVLYGLTSTYGSVANNAAAVTSHSLPFNVSPNTTYHYLIRSCFAGSNCTSTADATFITPAALVISARTVATNVPTTVISWTTNVAADAVLSYGPTTGYGSTVTDAAFTLSHALNLTVNSNTLYHFSIRACTATADCSTTTDSSFMTSVPGPVISNVNVVFNFGNATVTWDNDVAGDGVVNYGPTVAYGTVKSDYSQSRYHSMTFVVSPLATYHFAIRSCVDPNSCTTTADFTFTTPAAGPPPPPTDKTIVLLVNFLDYSVATPTTAAVSTTVFGSVNSYYQENSYGLRGVAGDVRDWMTIPLNRSCNQDLIIKTAISTAEQLDPNLHMSQYAHIIIIGPLSGVTCYDGASYVGPVQTSTRDGVINLSQSWIKNTAVSGYVLGHEYGHGLGVKHAAFEFCSPAHPSPNCDIWEYGDDADVMSGSFSLAGHFNAYHKDRMTWISGSSIAWVSSSGRYILEPIETPGPGIKTLKLQHGSSFLWVENRQRIGYDSALPLGSGDFYDGALLHILSATASRDSLLIDATQQNNGDDQIALRVGATYTDPVSNNIITVVNRLGDGSLTIDVTTPDATVPTVAVTSPTAGQVVSGVVHLAATASDNVGVARVDFYSGATLISSDTTAPFAADYNSGVVANGAATLKAVAYDAVNNFSQATVNVTITNSGPAVIITAPVAGDVAAGILTVAANVTPNLTGQVINRVEFLNLAVSATPIATDTTAPYSAAIDTSTMTNGSKQITVRAVDTLNRKTDVAVTIITANASSTPNPYIYMTSPVSNQVLRGAGTFTAVAVASSGVNRVEFYYACDSTPQLLGSVTSAPYQLTIDSGMISGPNSVVCAKVFDQTAHVVLSNSAVVFPDNPMSVTMSSPLPNDTLTGTVSLPATAPMFANGRALSKITWMVSVPVYGDIPVGSATTAPWSAAVDTTHLPTGSGYVWAQADYGPATSVSSTWIPVSIRNTEDPPSAPTIALNGLTQNMYVPNPAMTFSATTGDNAGVMSVMYMVDDAVVCQTSWLAGLADFSCATTLASGAHILKATATDFSGLSSSTADIQVTAGPDTLPPSLQFTYPFDGDVMSGSRNLELTANDNLGLALVEVNADDLPPFFSQTNIPLDQAASLFIPFDTTTLADGPHSIHARAVDPAGNTTLIITNVMIDNTPPSVGLDVPAEGATVSGSSYTVSATATDNNQIWFVDFYLNGTTPLYSTNAPYAFIWDTTTVPNGTYTLTATAVDVAGNATTSPPRTIIVDNTPVPAGDTGGGEGEIIPGGRAR